jgi:hypothetical protein
VVKAIGVVAVLLLLSQVAMYLLLSAQDSDDVSW